MSMTDRAIRVNKLIRKELSQIVLREVEFSPGILVTLTRVETSPNLIESRVYVGCIPESEQERALAVLKSQVWHLQQLLNKRLRTRPVPKIIFIKERETLEAAEVEAVLEKLKK